MARGAQRIWDEGSCTAAYELYVEREGKLPKAKHMNRACGLPDGPTFQRYTGISPLQYGCERYPELYAERRPDSRQEMAAHGGKRTLCIRLTTEEDMALYGQLEAHLKRTGQTKQGYLERLIDRDICITSHGGEAQYRYNLIERIEALLSRLHDPQDTSAVSAPGSLHAPDLGGTPSLNNHIQSTP